MTLKQRYIRKRYEFMYRSNILEMNKSSWRYYNTFSTHKQFQLAMILYYHFFIITLKQLHRLVRN